MPSSIQHRTKPSVTALIIMLSLVVAVVTARDVDAHDGLRGGHCYDPDPASTPLGRTVILDPGHGGSSDIGATNSNYGGPTLVEKELNLDIANRTKGILVGQGFRVCVTRITDVALTNTERAEYANSVAQADGQNVFILIHLNGGPESTNYTKTFWGKRAKDEAFSIVMHDAFWNELAFDVTNTPIAGFGDGRVGQFASGALLKANMPATLTESVFLTNNAEAARLAVNCSPSSPPQCRRQQIASRIAAGAHDWFY